MKLLLVVLISLLSFFALGQNKEVVRIDNLVKQIETDTTVEFHEVVTVKLLC